MKRRLWWCVCLLAMPFAALMSDERCERLLERAVLKSDDRL